MYLNKNMNIQSNVQLESVIQSSIVESLQISFGSLPHIEVKKIQCENFYQQIL